MFFTRAAALAASTVLLVSCGGDDGGGSDVSSGQDVADLVGCTGFEADSEEMFVTDGGSCTLDGEDIEVYYFAEQDAQDNYLDIAGGFGGQYLTGDNYIVGAPPAVLEELQADIGGEITGD